MLRGVTNYVIYLLIRRNHVPVGLQASASFLNKATIKAEKRACDVKFLFGKAYLCPEISKRYESACRFYKLYPPAFR